MVQSYIQSGESARLKVLLDYAFVWKVRWIENIETKNEATLSYTLVGVEDKYRMPRTFPA